ncbi:MAG: tol-pal system protein YbgF [Candidatus Aminicenantes bacterium]|nr:tol-pal system protein YbgF [Candidatus Aminicenantes bacterium]
MKIDKKHPVVFLLLLSVNILLLGTTSEQNKKVYELMYEDIQALKLQVQELTEAMKKVTGDLQVIKEQVKLLGELVRKSQAEENNFKNELRSNLPFQYQRLQGRLEEIQFQLNSLQESLQQLENLGLQPRADEKGKSISKKTEEHKSDTATPQVVTIPAQEMYNNAYGDYLKGNFDLAIESFRLFLQQYPNTPLSDNALYWIGESYYSQGKYIEAIEAFNELLLNYPSGDKVPPAYLKKGMSLLNMGKKEEALATFKLLVSKYPSQEESRLAQQKIKELVEK